MPRSTTWPIIPEADPWSLADVSISRRDSAGTLPGPEPAQPHSGNSYIGTDPATGRQLAAAFIDDLDAGRLVPANGAWSFIAAPGFSGRVDIPFSRFDGVSMDDGLIGIDAVKP